MRVLDERPEVLLSRPQRFLGAPSLDDVAPGPQRPFDDFGHPRETLLGLDDVVEGARLHGVNRDLLVSVAGHDHDGVARAFAALRQQHQSVAVGQPDIGDDEIDRLTFEDSDSLLSINGAYDLFSTPFQHIVHEAEHQRFIIGNQHFFNHDLPFQR